MELRDQSPRLAGAAWIIHLDAAPVVYINAGIGRQHVETD
jgi:hypothetical protein